MTAVAAGDLLPQPVKFVSAPTTDFQNRSAASERRQSRFGSGVQTTLQVQRNTYAIAVEYWQRWQVLPGAIPYDGSHEVVN